MPVGAIPCARVWRAAVLVLASSLAAPVLACEFEPAAFPARAAVLNAASLRLDDGRVIRVAGVDVPDRAAPEAVAALNAVVANHALEILPLTAKPDRYGRWPALLRAAGGTTLLQQQLLASGHGVVTGDRIPPSCRALLFASERAARDAGRGIWANAAGLQRADKPADILARRGEMTVVEGRVLSVREAGSTIYLNFGRRWSEDFTATTLKRRESAFKASGTELKSLAGRLVRIRGVVEERGGPWIELTRPDQLEIPQN